ncbi:hypothetical protein [Georgenia sp. AZ-5]|uniref:hypothetical protein n=1 Tax=Georgenia sp. AZ-5 TaxID=3367526 RepID=UPI0037542E1A
MLQPLRNDEAGYLLVARQWHAGGEFLYGDYFVDRPPLLMAIFRLAALTQWDAAIRVFAIPFTLLFVLAAWHAGTLLAGRSGGRWAASAGAAVMCCPMMAADHADGELFGAALVMASLALGLAAWRSGPTRRQPWLAGWAGALAAAAPLVKQNLLEGVLFLTLLVVVAAVARRRVGRRELRVATAAVLGALVPTGVAGLLVVAAGVDPGALWHDLAGFRRAALEVIWSNRPRATIDRAVMLVAVGVVTGLLGIVGTWCAAARPALRRASPEHWAVTGLLLFGLAAIAAGGSYWPSYLLQLGPAAVLAVAMVAPSPSRGGRWMRTTARMLVGAAVLGTLVAVVAYAVVPRLWFQQRTGEWLAASASPGDTAFVAYGSPSVLEAADLASPYPYLWSLPMRTLDPDQERLRATLRGPQAPAWIVEINGFNSWGIDAGSRLRDLVTERYRVVADVCASPVWLREDLTRRLAPPPRC